VNDFGLSDHELFPLLDETGSQMLRRLREHPHAPRYNWRTGERLDAAGLQRVRDYATAFRRERRPWQPGHPPIWVEPFARQCGREVPFYRSRGVADFSDFSEIPLTRRDDIRRQPCAFVRAGLPIDDLIVYSTSGTSGTSLRIPAVPEVPCRYLPLLEHALDAVGVRFEGGRRVSLVHVCAQHPTVVLCSVMSHLDGAGFVKVNLHPDDWRRPEDAVRFLDDCHAEVYTGDPFALAELMKIPLRNQPKALISGASALSPGLWEALKAHFQCPVIDLYSSNESGPIAFATAKDHEILPHDLYVEIVGADGRPLPPGVRGEITLTGGINPYLPLVRYAIRDFAALEYPETSMPRLTDFHGRKPVAFVNCRGQRFNSVDVTSALAGLPVPAIHLHQRADGTLLLRTVSDQEIVAAVRTVLSGLFGAEQPLIVGEPVGTDRTAKPIHYSSGMTGEGA